MKEYSVFIQHDWEECIRSIGNQVWISVKERNGTGIHGHLQCKSLKLNGIPVLNGTNGFQVESVSAHAIQVKHSSCASCFTLLSPYRIFKGVHNASVTSLDVIGGQCVSGSDSMIKSWSSLDHEKEREVTMNGHYGDIYCCRWFPSGKVVLSCGADLRIKIWSSDTGKCAATLVGHTQAVNDLAIVDRGRNIISVSKDGTAKLWHVGSGKVIDDIINDHTMHINCCSISSPMNINLGERDKPVFETEIGTDNKCLLVGCQNGIISLIGVYSRKRLVTNNLDVPVNACHLDINAQSYVGCDDGRVIWLDEQLVIKHCVFDTNSPVRCLCLFKELVVCGHVDGSCVVRSVNRRKAYLTGTNADPVYDVCTDSTRFLYTACRDGIIRKYLPELLLN